jgi:hypothetical protein
MGNFKGLVFGPKVASKNRAKAVLSCHLMKQSRFSEIGGE